ncbi:hypothetical protein SAMN04489729_6680 [Amycolatopsis lurida]|uniref:Membrane protein n=1 Tax=Amycolatopsis lurida NRRL 2430 TaxID=1460371 RepID=A0A2P2FPI7_AMYLU|nr:hypothetical protein [Amycolatopsis lurida]KFU78634.1 membrane protein [Amycolatopsis lurida NRRL 2430]SEE20407.1 hypothetical protein SAMN04489729_6680 [Amycolatopsis lurida]
MSKLLGLGIAATGLAHFAAPAAFEPVTKLAFADDIRNWTYRNGATELAIGLAIAAAPTRKAGFAGLAVYAAWLGKRVLARR